MSKFELAVANQLKYGRRGSICVRLAVAGITLLIRIIAGAIWLGYGSYVGLQRIMRWIIQSRQTNA